ncbi:MAG: Crp/Fnr family transcriptional regulator [Piscinibacter sp.]|uniref:Crp/Fnr family transcriptional regulator n=1 Tax=Piscinibacter sp. TaxID=1903157 RepID=UPI003D0C18C2
MPGLPTTDELHALLARGRWFASLAPLQQRQLFEAGAPRSLAAGQVLFRRGDANTGLYAVLAGAIQVGAPGSAAREAVLGVLEPPQWFGEIACLDGGTRTHDARAQSAASLLHVPLAALLRLAEDDPAWWRHLGRLLAEKTRALFAGLEDLALQPAPVRVARRLLAMSTGHGMRADGAALRRLAVSQEQLGAMLSLTRQTVSEVLRDFEAEGWVRRRYGAVELLDAAGLEAAVAAAIEAATLGASSEISRSAPVGGFRRPTK